MTIFSVQLYHTKFYYTIVLGKYISVKSTYKNIPSQNIIMNQKYNSTNILWFADNYLLLILVREYNLDKWVTWLKIFV